MPFLATCVCGAALELRLRPIFSWHGHPPQWCMGSHAGSWRSAAGGGRGAWALRCLTTSCTLVPMQAAGVLRLGESRSLHYVLMPPMSSFTHPCARPCAHAGSWRCTPRRACSAEGRVHSMNSYAHPGVHKLMCAPAHAPMQAAGGVRQGEHAAHGHRQHPRLRAERAGRGDWWVQLGAAGGMVRCA